MLALDDPRWNELQHAYGGAGDIPGLLRALEAAPGPTQEFDDEPWFSLWSRLCHQDDACTAAYAAVPHVVRIAVGAAGPVDFSFLLLPTSIEIARRRGRGPELPADLSEAYLAAIGGLPRVSRLHGETSGDEAMERAAAAARAVAEGTIAVAETLSDPEDD